MGLLVVVIGFGPGGWAQTGTQVLTSPQPVLGHRTVALLRADGLEFKDLDRNGKLDGYEDWRLTPEARTADLLGRMSLEEQAGLLVHGTLASFGPMGVLGIGSTYDLSKVRPMIDGEHVNCFITRLEGSAKEIAHENNEVQALAEQSRWAIPVTVSSDPRSHFQEVLGASSKTAAFSVWPEALGFGAIDDAGVTRQFGDVVRQEYMAVGIRESLAPQADLVTEPRWARANGTFGEDAETAKRMVAAYVTGIQGGGDGLSANSVIAVVKHWVGYGAVKDGWDSHNYYGRFAAFPGGNFEQHVVPFTGAFAAGVGAVMPTYPILEGVTVEGKALEPVGAGFNGQLLEGMLRGKYGFKGVVLSDWAITNDCNEVCRNGAAKGSAAGPGDIGMPWGVESLTRAERFAKAIDAGVDQIGRYGGLGADRSRCAKGADPGSAGCERRRGRVLVQEFEMGFV